MNNNSNINFYPLTLFMRLFTLTCVINYWIQAWTKISVLIADGEKHFTNIINDFMFTLIFALAYYPNLASAAIILLFKIQNHVYRIDCQSKE